MDATQHSILLTDSQVLVRQGLTCVIDSFSQYRVQWQAGNADEALEIISQHRPDLMVLELALPGRSGVELMHELRRRDLHVKTLVVTSLDAEHTVRLALGAGVLSYFLKSCTVEQFETALDMTMRNEQCVQDKFARLLDLIRAGTGRGGDAMNGDPLAVLSTREREIFHLLADGLQNSVIAKKLYISPRTVETHRARVVRKLGLHSNSELIRFAIKHGLSTV